MFLRRLDELEQLDAIVAIDFFGAEGRATAEGLVSGLEAALKQEGEVMQDGKTAATPPPGPLKDQLWVTRQGVQVDRIASAWPSSTSKVQRSPR